MQSVSDDPHFDGNTVAILNRGSWNHIQSIPLDTISKYGIWLGSFRFLKILKNMYTWKKNNVSPKQCDCGPNLCIYLQTRKQCWVPGLGGGSLWDIDPPIYLFALFQRWGWLYTRKWPWPDGIRIRKLTIGVSPPNPFSNLSLQHHPCDQPKESRRKKKSFISRLRLKMASWYV